MLADRFDAVRAATERLAAPLSAEDQVVQSMPDASPTKWHRAHTTWFFAEFVLGADGTGTRPWDVPEYRFLFNSYYEAVGARHPRPDRGLITRPALDDVARYRSSVEEEVRGLLAAGCDPAVATVVELGTHHEQQHQELLLIDIKHVLSANPAVSPAYAPEPCPPPPTDHVDGPGWVEIDGGLVEVGWSGEGFAFDNEGPRHEVQVYDSLLADRLVTAGEWLAFIDDGGYERPELWKSDGWGRVQADGWTAPLYWRRDPDTPERWLVHTLGGLRPVRADEPVIHVSYYEADAFATWSDARLPTEFEWELAATTVAIEGRLLDPLADHPVLHPRPAPATSSPGLRQMYGDCWEWTSSAYQPYPRFAPAAGAIGEYNGKFMSGQQVLRGGSVFTPRDHIRRSYRNFFHPHTRWHAAGLRLARDERT